MEDAQNEMVRTAAQAVLLALNPNQSPNLQRDAIVYLENLKNGDIGFLVYVSYELVKSHWPVEVRHYGLKMLQYLVRSRWGDLGAEGITVVSTKVVEMISFVATPHEAWGIKSQAAALVAEVARREGSASWSKLFEFLKLQCDLSPVHAELVAMVLRCLPEDITVHNEDLEGDRRRELLRGLTSSLTEVLPLILKVIQNCLAAGVNAYAQNCFDAVKAALNAAIAYAEWAPIPDLGRFHMIQVCEGALGDTRFRSSACEFLKLISQRRRPSDETAKEFDMYMEAVFDIVVQASVSISKSETKELNNDDLEFASSLCESMVILGSNNLYCISGNAGKLKDFLTEMYHFLRNGKFVLHIEALSFWLFLFRELCSSAKANEQTGDGGRGKVNSASGFTDKGKAAIVESIISEHIGEILNVAFECLLKRSVASAYQLGVNSVEKWTDDFASKCSYSQYRGKLHELIRLIATQSPVTAAFVISERVKYTLELFYLHNYQDITMIEDTHLALETTVSGIFDGGLQNRSVSVQYEKILDILGGILKHFLDIKWQEPLLVEIHGKLLTSMGPYVKLYQEKTWQTIQKLFELLSTIPILPKNQEQGAVPMHRIRLQLCVCFVRIAKVADVNYEVMKLFGELVLQQYNERRILSSELIILGEALLIMASAFEIHQQEEVLKVLLAPLKDFWVKESPVFSDPNSLIYVLESEPGTTENDILWNIYHTVNFFERALKSGRGKRSLHTLPQDGAAYEFGHSHPISSHISWIAVPLLKLLQCIHLLHTHESSRLLQAALVVTSSEQTALLGDATERLKGAGDVNASRWDLSKGEADGKEHQIQNWTKGVRESGYNFLGLAMSLGDPFFNYVDFGFFFEALLGNLEAMEFRHVRLLIHLVIIPLVKSCPPHIWDVWISRTLWQVLKCCETFLLKSWDSVQKEGRAIVPDRFLDSSALGLMKEVMEEKLLRDLTRECCNLMAVLASPGLNRSLPPAEQLVKTDTLPLLDTQKISKETLIGFLVKDEKVLLHAFKISNAAFTWPDSESVIRVAAFCGSIVPYGIAAQHPDLQEFIANAMFEQIIRGLALESNATVQAELVGLCREIYVHLSARYIGPRRVLSSLPCLTEAALLDFELAFSHATTVKEQKMLIRSLLIAGAGDQMKALTSAQKNSAIITNISTSRTVSTRNDMNSREDGLIGLASLS